MKQFTWIMYSHCKISKVIFEVFHTRKKWSRSHESCPPIAKPAANWSTTANVCFSFNTLLVPHKLLVIVHPICPNLNWQYQSDYDTLQQLLKMLSIKTCNVINEDVNSIFSKQGLCRTCQDLSCSPTSTGMFMQVLLLIFCLH